MFIKHPSNTVRFIFPILIGVAFSGCRSTRPSVQQPSRITHPDPLLQQDVLAVLWYQQSAECRALYYQAFNVARDRLDRILADDTTSRKKAVVLDIDETILDNSPWEAQIIKDNADLPGTWEAWVRLAQAAPLPGARRFLEYVVSKGIDVYYISNRSEKNLKPTIKNLRKWNFPQADSDHVLLATTMDNKTARRDLVRRTHEIILLLGDNLGDFEQLFQKKPVEERNELVDREAEQFGRKFIVFPNPVYGEWNQAVYQYAGDKPDSVKAKNRLRALQSFHENANHPPPEEYE